MVLCSWKKKAGELMPENRTQQELDFERKHEQDLQRLRGLRLIDARLFLCRRKGYVLSGACKSGTIL